MSDLKYNTSTVQGQAPQHPNPFLNIPLEIAQHPRLCQSTKLVYGDLNRLAKINAKRDKEIFCITQKKLAEHVGRSARTVKRAIHELRENELIVVLTTGRCNHYRVLPLVCDHDVPVAVDNSPDPVQKPEEKGDTSVPRIEERSGGTETIVLKDYACTPPNPGFKLLETPLGKHLVSRLILIQYDWIVDKNPELSPQHRLNRQRKNRRDVADFVGKYGLQALEYVIDRCESTSLQNSGAVLHSMITGKLFKSEHEKFLTMRDVA